MQVSADIDEADVGKIRAGMEASFTVDAYPRETFQGVISQVRLAPVLVQNVVTYSAMIDVPNPLLKLKPGMTANVKILIDQAEHVLKIPNSALRFQPNLPDEELEQAFKEAGESEFYARQKAAKGANAGAPSGRMGLGSNRKTNPGGTRGRRVALWVMEPDKSIRPVVVRLGITDGAQTELESGALKEGDKIVTGMETSERPPANSSRPPGFPRGMRGIR